MKITTKVKGGIGERPSGRKAPIEIALMERTMTAIMKPVKVELGRLRQENLFVLKV